jgi:hypothetical protein
LFASVQPETHDNSTPIPAADAIQQQNAASPGQGSVYMITPQGPTFMGQEQNRGLAPQKPEKKKHQLVLAVCKMHKAETSTLMAP